MILNPGSLPVKSMKTQSRSSLSKSGWTGSVQSLFSSWAVVVFVGILACLVLLVFLSLALYLSYGFSNNPADTLSIPTATSESQITWYENSVAFIESDDLEGMFMALGVAHATAYPWQMHLWRQTAVGSLTQWFGAELSNIDRFSKRLQFSSLAQESYNQLPDEQSRLLDAYTNGVNAALHDSKKINQNELTLLDVTPEKWQPWHTLAIERMFAWLSLDIHTLTVDTTGTHYPEWLQIRQNDYALKEWLQLHGFKYSMAGLWPPDTLSERTSFHRFVYGSSAIPLFQELIVQLGENPKTHVASIPGTFLFPSGHSINSTWFILPTSSAQLGLQSPSTLPTITHDRIKSRDGSEVLLTLKNYHGWLLPNDSQTPLDSLPALSWKGFMPGSDLAAFISLLSGQTPTFTLLDGHGLVTHDSSWTLLGTPPFVYSLKNGVLIGGTPWTKYQASRLNHLLSNSTSANPLDWPNDCHNDWAEEQATFLLEEYLPRRISLDEKYADALTYLRNWDFTYTPSSIGAIIFDSWLQELPDSLYQRVIQKELIPSDTLARIYLQNTIASLKEDFGNDLSKWRLDITKPILRYYPAWNADSLFDTKNDNLSKTLYAPLSFPGRGHISTLCWGSFRSNEDLEVSTRWDSWSTHIKNQHIYQWRRHEAPNSFLGRYRISNSPSTTHSFEQGANIKTTTLINKEE